MKKNEYSVIDVANAFIDIAHKHYCDITNFVLQNIVFIAYQWYKKLSNKELFDDKFIEWNKLPIIQKLHDELSKYGDGNVIQKIQSITEIPSDSFEYDFLEKIYEHYKNYSNEQFVAEILRRKSWMKERN